MISYPHSSPPLLRCSRLSALRTILGTEDHLHWSASDASADHTFSHLVQPRARFYLTSVLPLSIFGAAPEDFSSGGCSRPNVVVHIQWIGLFAPHTYFAPEDEMR